MRRLLILVVLVGLISVGCGKDDPPTAPATGACCSTTRACTVTVEASCDSPSTWHGDWPACMPNPCPSSTAPPLRNPDNGHYYELIDVDIDWNGAVLAASGMSYLGEQGHLATITSAQENLFLTDAFGATAVHYHWIGGSQAAESSGPGAGWSWVTGESFSYANWAPGEPNDFDGSEDAILFDHGVLGDGKAWNDLVHSVIARGFVVEYDTAPHFLR